MNESHRLRLVIDVDDYEPRHIDMINRIAKNCRMMHGKFLINVFAVPGMMNKIQLKNLMNNETLVPCLHGFNHTPKECLRWTKSKALSVFKWAEENGFSKVFKAPYWIISDGTYEAAIERDWIIADRKVNRARAEAIGLRSRNHYFVKWDMSGIDMIKKTRDIIKMGNTATIHGHPKHMERIENFIANLILNSNVTMTFCSIRKYVKKKMGKP